MASAEIILNVTQFKARSLSLMTDLSEGRLDKIVVTKRGRPLAVVSPPSPAAAGFDELCKSLKDTVWIDPAVDLTAPILEDGWQEDMLKEWDELNP